MFRFNSWQRKKKNWPGNRSERNVKAQHCVLFLLFFGFDLNWHRIWKQWIRYQYTLEPSMGFLVDGKNSTRSPKQHRAVHRQFKLYYPDPLANPLRASPAAAPEIGRSPRTSAPVSRESPGAASVRFDGSETPLVAEEDDQGWPGFDCGDGYTGGLPLYPVRRRRWRRLSSCQGTIMSGPEENSGTKMRHFWYEIAPFYALSLV